MTVPPSAPCDPPEPSTRAELFERVHGKLKEIAATLLSDQRATHRLQATALVHEVWLALDGPTPGGGERFDRGAFLAAAAEAMRRVLVDHAHGSLDEGHEEGRRRVPRDPMELAARYAPNDILALDDAIHALAARDPQLAELAKLRVYAGLSETEAANALGIDLRIQRSSWQFAEAFLHRALNQHSADERPEEGQEL